MQEFFKSATYQNHPIRVLIDFLANENSLEQAKQYNLQRFVGYALSIGYDSVTMITSDPYKVNVGGVPRNSFLIMVPDDFDGIPPHFTLLRVLETTETPLSREVQQTYFELQKRSMPELDIFTQSELQWSALKVEVLGMFYPGQQTNELEFSSDLNNYLSAHKYRIYSPTEEILDLIINSQVQKSDQFQIGKLRLTENNLRKRDQKEIDVPAYVAPSDFMGTRTALFGKTRLGKSNTIKVIIQSLIETTKNNRNVGQLIFDVNGEYANDNPQNRSLPSIFPDVCEVYALTKKKNTESKFLKLNFYEVPDKSHEIVSELLNNDRKTSSSYVKSFITANIPSIEEYRELQRGDKVRAKRKILFYWAILKKSGFDIDEIELIKNTEIEFDPKFNKAVKEELYGDEEAPTIHTLSDLVSFLDKLAAYIRTNGQENLKSTGSKSFLLDSDDTALLEFLNPRSGIGTRYLQPYKAYHAKNAGDFVKEVIESLNKGNTVIIDLGNAHPLLMQYYSEYLSRSIFSHQVTLFSEDQLGDKYIQLYFEEAHNLFPNTETSTVDIFRRIAKEGAKYNLGMVYSTQSVSTIHPDLLAQTENFFVAHMSSEQETNALGRLNVEFVSSKNDILRLKRKGFIRMLTRSHRFVIPVQIRKFGE